MMNSSAVKRLIAACAVLFAASVLFAETKKPVDGYGGAKFGAALQEVRKLIKGRIIFDDEKRMIVTRDGEISYKYGFVYKEKAAVKQEAPVAPKADAAVQPNQPAAAPAQPAVQPQKPVAAKPAEESEGESKYFYTILEFPYITLDEIRKKLVAEYGEPTGDTLNRAQGALIWDSGDGVAIAWIDAYEKKPYCRRISYISKKIAKELNEHQNNVFNRRELEVIKNIVP